MEKKCKNAALEDDVLEMGNFKNKKADKKIQVSISESGEKPASLMDVLKENLTCEMYHALLDVFDSKHFIIKIHLSIFLLVSYGLASYMTLQLIMNYFNYGVTSSVRTIYETPALFPKVTFCNVNSFTTKEAYDFLNSIDTDGVFKSMEKKSFYNIGRAYRQILFTTEALLSNKTDDFKKRMGHDLNDILIGCKFNYQECTAEDFVWTWNDNFGNCFSFNTGSNSKPLKYTDIAGYNFGLELDLYVNFYEELSYLNSIFYGRGAIILIDNVTHLVDRVYDGIFVSSGMTTYIALKRESKSMLPKPYSDCVIDQGKDTVHDSDLYNLIKNSPYDYTQKFCFQQCLQKLVIEKCNCHLSNLESLINANICVTSGQVNCAVLTYLSIYGKNNYPEKNCLPNCPLECNSTQITSTTTSFELLGNVYEKFIKNNKNLSSDFLNTSITNGMVKRSVVRVYVYYETLSYMQSDEAPQIDIISLIANIGGNLGLFLGVSLFSVWEIVITLLEIYFYRKQQKNIQIKP
jgi:hypothetical protein